jgi:hypothetical protein
VGTSASPRLSRRHSSARHIGQPANGRESTARFVVLVDGDPFDIRTDSGSAPNMIHELERRGALLKAVSTEPPKVLDFALKVWSKIIGRRKRETWTAVHLHPLRRSASALIGRMKCRRIRDGADAWLQIGLMVDSAVVPLRKNDFRCCLFDDNHATFVKSRYYEPDRMGRFDRVLLAFEAKTCRNMDLVLAQSRTGGFHLGESGGQTDRGSRGASTLLTTAGDGHRCAGRTDSPYRM